MVARAAGARKNIQKDVHNATTGDAVADVGNPTELLGVDVDELAGTLPLVPHDRCKRTEALEAIETEATQDAPDGRERQAEPAGDHRQVSLCRRSASIAATCSAAAGDDLCRLLLIEHAMDHQESTIWPTAPAASAGNTCTLPSITPRAWLTPRASPMSAAPGVRVLEPIQHAA